MFDHHVVGTFGDHPIADVVDASFPFALMHVDGGGGAKIVARSVHAEKDDRSAVGVGSGLGRRCGGEIDEIILKSIGRPCTEFF